MSENELEDQAPRAYDKADGKIREIERDVAKRWKKGNIRVACVGLGKQETARNLHNMGMDNDFIAKALNISVELVKQWLTTASA